MEPTFLQVYGLNRLGLVQERTRVLQHLFFLASTIEELDDIVAQLLRTDPNHRIANRLELLIERIMEEIKRMARPDQPYCSLVKAWLHAY